MNTQNLKKILVSLAAVAFLGIGQASAADAAAPTSSTNSSTSGSTDPNTANDSDSLDNTLPITLEQFDKLRALIQRQSDNAVQLDNDFQAWLDDLLGTTPDDKNGK